MLSYSEALKSVLTRVPPARSVRVALEAARGRVLAEPVAADLDSPPFEKALMDGYALRSEDVGRAPVALRVVGRVAAGQVAPMRLQAGQAVQIMTGAMLPEGADAVQRIERTETAGRDEVRILEPVRPGENMAPRGQEVRKGQTVLEPGRPLGPAELGVLAAVGKEFVQVYEAPRVAVIPTGDEIVEVGVTPGPGQIRNSNGPMLRAQCRALGLDAGVLPAVPDDPGLLREALRRGFQRELILLSGGVSMGEHDYVPRVLAEEGVEVVFHKAAIKPGKPILMGRRNDRLIFGLPGNPVSSFVTFELFVRPAVRRWMGFSRLSLRNVSGRLLRDVRHRPGRQFFKPARSRWTERGLEVEPLETTGSADLVGFSRANSLLVVDAAAEFLAADSTVQVLLLEG